MRTPLVLTLAALGVASTAASASAQFMRFGDGCTGTAGELELVLAPGTTVTGSTQLQVHDANGSPATLLLGFSRVFPGADLGVIGMPGCDLYVNPTVTLPMPSVFGTPLVTLDTSAAPPCLEFYVQAASIDPGANQLGVTTSNGATIALDPVAETVLHVATVANTAANWTDISEPSIDGEPGAVVLYTHDWTASGGSYLDHATGIYYVDEIDQWSIFNQDIAPMPLGHAFHVFLPNSGATQLVATKDTSQATGPWVEIDDAAINGDPNAMVFAVPVWNPNGQPGVYHDAHVGVWYDALTSRWTVFRQDQSNMPDGASFNVVVADANLTTSQDAFLHVSTAGNTTLNRTELSHPELDGNPDASLIVCQRYGPGFAQYNDQAVGVYYSPLSQTWWIYNEDPATSMPVGAGFNVLLGEPLPRGSNWTHVTASGNVVGQSTRIDDPALDGDPSAFFLTTQRWDSATSVYNDHTIGVWYSGATDRWNIFNQDIAPMPVGAFFNVLVPNSGATKFLATATPASITANYMHLDHPALNGNPDAFVFLTQNYSGVGVYNDHEVGVWYDSLADRWAVFNQDLAAMPNDASFNVLVADERLSADSRPFGHTATASTISNHLTVIDHSQLNGDPHARVIVTKSWRNGVYHDDPIGVYYASGQWRIFNQNFDPMPVGATFHVLVAGDCQ